MPDSCDIKRDAHRFVKLLRAPHSTLQPFIQCLFVNGPDVGHASSEEDYDVLNALISEHLPLLCNLRTITIFCVTWRCLRPESKALIGSLSQLTTFIWQSVATESLHDLIGFCSTNFSSHLQALKFRQIKVTEPEFQDVLPPSSPGHSFPRLRLLDVASDTVLRPLLSVLSIHIQLHNIDTLCLGGVSTNHMPLVHHFIEAAGPSLRHIALGITSSAMKAGASENCALIPVSHVVIIRFSRCRSQSLSLLRSPSMRTRTYAVWKFRRFIYIHSYLAIPPGYRPLSQRSLRIHSKISRYGSGLRKEMNGSIGLTFSPLSELSFNVSTPCLPVLHTKFVQTPAWRVAQNDGLVTAVERQLPELHKRGLLVVYLNGQPLSKALDGWWPYVW